MNCRQVKEELTAFLHGELDDELASKIKEHFSKCESCSEEVRMLERTGNLIRFWKDIEPSPDLSSKLLARAREELEEGRKPFRDFVEVLRGKPLPAASALVLVILIVVSAILFQRPPIALPPLSSEADALPLREARIVYPEELLTVVERNSRTNRLSTNGANLFADSMLANWKVGAERSEAELIAEGAIIVNHLDLSSPESAITTRVIFLTRQGKGVKELKREIEE